jgi:hypothetical protein
MIDVDCLVRPNLEHPDGTADLAGSTIAKARVKESRIMGPQLPNVVREWNHLGREVVWHRHPLLGGENVEPVLLQCQLAPIARKDWPEKVLRDVAFNLMGRGGYMTSVRERDKHLRRSGGIRHDGGFGIRV